MRIHQYASTLFGLLIAVHLVSGSTKQADEPNTFLWTGRVSDDWRDADNWYKLPGTVGDYPRRPCDKAIIQSAPFYDVRLGGSDQVGAASSGIAIGELVINSGTSVTITANTLVITTAGGLTGKLTIQRERFLAGALNVDTGGVLKLASPVVHEIGGAIELRTATSDLIVLDDVAFEPWHWITGDVVGTITGHRDSAEIRIARGKTLTNSVVIAGHMFIHAAPGQATLHLKAPGTLWANGDGSLELEDNLILTDAPADNALPLYKSAGTIDSILRIKAQARDLVGQFEVSECGRIDFVSNVATTGDLLLIHGRIEVAPNRTFTYDTDYDIPGSMISNGKCTW
ncbi:MAG: hypothetical protein L0219_20245 [Phycisphaerales bacterium]|nr:hypothetical protein [Phycisphaerales bacterium]